MNDALLTELERILAEKEIKLEAVRIRFEKKIAVIEGQKAERLEELETEEAVQLEKLRQGGNSIGFFGPKNGPKPS